MPIKYAVYTACDQTYVFVSNEEGGTTTKHPEAKLWDDVGEASAVAVKLSVQQAVFMKNGGHPEYPLTWTDEQIIGYAGYWIEAVTDEVAFRAQEDTW